MGAQKGAPVKPLRLACVLSTALLAPSGWLLASGASAAAPVPVQGAPVAAASAKTLPAFDECGWSGSFEKRLVQPKSVIIACGDGNIGLIDLHWTSWGQTMASATGVDTWNTCVPNCAASNKWDSTPVVVSLTHPVPEPGGPLFGLLTVKSTKSPKAPGVGKWEFLPNPCSAGNRAWTESEGESCADRS